jgi:hypothetical protein
MATHTASSCKEGSGALALAPCEAGSAGQVWAFNASTGALAVTNPPGGGAALCLTAPAPPPPAPAWAGVTARAPPYPNAGGDADYRGYTLRLVGVHLKSKLPSPSGEDLIRRCEADQLRLLVERILSEDPHANLLVYGDLNDTREQPAVRQALGPWGGVFTLQDLPAEDPQGDRWTYYRQFTGVYSRIDYLLVSRALKPELSGTAGISRAPEWKNASDHRLLYTRISPRDR